MSDEQLFFRCRVVVCKALRTGLVAGGIQLTVNPGNPLG